jgi:hypothetical protein
MSRPTRLPEWATDDDYPADAAPEASTPNKVEPTSGKKAIGWRPGEFPPAQSLNDWMRLVYDWLEHLDEFSLESTTREFGLAAGDLIKMTGAATYDSDADTWTGVGVFVCGLRVAEGEMIDRIDLLHNRGNNGQIDLALLSKDVADGSVDTGALASITTGTGYDVVSITPSGGNLPGPIPATVPADRIYMLRVTTSAAQNVVHGIDLSVTRTSSVS